MPLKGQVSLREAPLKVEASLREGGLRKGEVVQPPVPVQVRMVRPVLDRRWGLLPAAAATR